MPAGCLHLGAQTPRRAAIAAGVSVALLAAACSATGPASPGTHSAAPSSGHQAPGSAAQRPAGPPSLQVSPAAYQLPSGVSREVVLPDGQNLLIAGGLTPQATSTAAVRVLNPVTGSTTPAGRLAAPTHDAAGATVGGRTFIFGGGDQTSVATVQAIAPGGTASVAGRLPGPRSDLMAVMRGGTAYLLGGYDGASYDPAILATTDGHRFSTAASLPVPVRYPAVAALGDQIWLFGGQSSNGITNDIQRVSLPGAGQKSGKAAVVGHLPQPMSGGSAFALGGTLYVAGGQVTAAVGAGQTTASPSAATTVSDTVLSYHPGRAAVTVAGRLPVPVAYAGAAVLNSTAFLIGGDNGVRSVPTVTRLQLVPASSAVPSAGAGSAAAAAPSVQTVGGAAAAGGPVVASEPWLGPPQDRGHLAPHSDPSVLPGDVLIADDQNSRLLIVDPQGRIRWQFPEPGDLGKGQHFMLPDDAFFSPDGKDIIATEEDYSVVSVIDIATHRITYRYGTPGTPGAGPNHLSNPDDAMILPGGSILSADIKNCRLLLIRPPAHHPEQIIGQTSNVCLHDPPLRFGSPNGAFPMTNGHYLVTEINGDWASEMSLSGHVYWSTNPPGVAYPSDTNEVYPGRYLTADYSAAGQVVEFSSSGRLLWRFGGLNHPSLALPLPNGDILVNDDYNDRVIVIDPVSDRIVWQYGHTGVASTAPGYLSDPDGVDVTPPDSMLIAHAATMGAP
ncbi:MAG TPA: hypothetical protein VMV92_33060 [Streptosporangiaceae bacterium]|nr:hypothetical protein [Streptosporangiaceae bacterium]